ncbi:hypothetical protein PY257_02660 [Ramlibacter sp. H39-3-26]|uniref:hypothetical protein n=1 Tax=Curvibacter soli TaxID=3031331 RepID=UPI0023DA7D66|nr:hypothetical protein [Ramlibacter sp. H39-3-26]MDF1484093.1 hypothetical protein [Ramlibacter sp. H39-3-26]
MLPRMQCDIVRGCGEAIKTLTAEMDGEEELFASANTLACVELSLLAMAQTMGHLSPALCGRLAWVDWDGWQALRGLLERDVQPRREEVWYGVRSLVPATLHLIDQLRRHEPVWFEIAY